VRGNHDVTTCLLWGRRADGRGAVVRTLARSMLPTIALLLLAACAPAAPQSTQQGGRSDQSKTLVVAVRGEPAALSGKEFVEGLGVANAKRLFNANLALIDDQENASPYLAEVLPQLDTDTWRVFPDGRMETVFRLRENLTWHDGAPLTAEDFVFARRVYATPELGVSRSSPDKQMDSVTAPDARTLVIQWRELFPDAGTLSTSPGSTSSQSGTFQALPRHILEGPFNEMATDAFARHAYWTQDYVGAGPYRLVRWEPGAFIEAEAFAGHALGRPRIERVQITFIPDPNTVVANLLAGAAHVALDFSIGFQDGLTLQRQWSGNGGGIVLNSPTKVHWIQTQFRPEMASPRAMLDVRVRKALAHAMDKRALSEAMFEARGQGADSLVYPNERWFAAVDRAIARYPYDVRQAEQLLNQAGFTRQMDGAFVGSGDEKLSVELRVSAGAENEQEVAILSESWRRAGFDATEHIYPVSLLRDGQYRASFPALLLNPAGGGINALTSASVAAPDNRWTGANRGGWSDSDYDRLYDAFQATLETNRRADQVAGMMRIMTEQLPVLPVQYAFTVVAHVAGLRGPVAGNDANWNAHLWEWT
jgi:peptide/nickel transport system substrate-binding protein